MKKIFSFLFLMLAILTFVGCGKMSGPQGDLQKLMDKIYEGIPEDELPYLEINEIISEDYEFTRLFGQKSSEIMEKIKKISYKEIIISQSANGSIPHAVVLIRMDEATTGAKIEETKKLIKDNADKAWLRCVEAENLIVESNGDLILFAMVDTLDYEDETSLKIASVLKENFLALK